MNVPLSNQLASLLETYIIRDVSKIVWQYFFDGLEAFVYGQPRFEMLVGNFTDSFRPYEKIFQEDGSCHDNSDYSYIRTYLKEVPKPCWHTSAGEMKFTVDWNRVDLKFEENFLFKPQYGDPDNIVFFIVEMTTKQVVFSYFPFSYDKESRNRWSHDMYVHPAFESVELTQEKNPFKLKWIRQEDPRLCAFHRETKLELFFIKKWEWVTDYKDRFLVFDMDQIKEFTSKFSSKYPL